MCVCVYIYIYIYTHILFIYTPHSRPKHPLSYTQEHADSLASFCHGRARAGKSGYCNLIPYNPTSAGDLKGYATPSDERVRAFHARLRDEHGIHALVRWTSSTGRDATGGCGQLVLEQGAQRRVKG